VKVTKFYVSSVSVAQIQSSNHTGKFIGQDEARKGNGSALKARHNNFLSHIILPITATAEAQTSSIHTGEFIRQVEEGGNGSARKANKHSNCQCYFYS
jgi:hypothetical protein